jgi:hypothetical protein
VSPVFDLHDATMVIVSYWRWYTNNRGSNPNEDYWRVQATSDGTNWVYLENTTSSNAAWQQFAFDLDNYVSLTSTVRFRFVAEDAGAGGSLVEAAVDDFKIEAIYPSGPDPSLSTIAVNDDLMLRPDGLGDSTMTVTVTVRNGSGNPIPGIPAGDVIVSGTGVSLNGRAMIFCATGAATAQFASTQATNASGQVSFAVTQMGGCGDVTWTATVQGVSLAGSAVATVRSPDLTGNGVVNFQDTNLFLILLQAASGYCGNLSGDAGNVVNFLDTAKYLPALIAGAQCP